MLSLTGAYLTHAPPCRTGCSKAKPPSIVPHGVSLGMGHCNDVGNMEACYVGCMTNFVGTAFSTCSAGMFNSFVSTCSAPGEDRVPLARCGHQACICRLRRTVGLLVAWCWQRHGQAARVLAPLHAGALLWRVRTSCTKLPPASMWASLRLPKSPRSHRANLPRTCSAPSPCSLHGRGHATGARRWVDRLRQQDA